MIFLRPSVALAQQHGKGHWGGGGTRAGAGRLSHIPKALSPLPAQARKTRWCQAGSNILSVT